MHIVHAPEGVRQHCFRGENKGNSMYSTVNELSGEFYWIAGTGLRHTTTLKTGTPNYTSSCDYRAHFKHIGGINCPH